MDKRNDSGVEVKLPSDREIVITRTFQAPRELVFEAWTTPKHVAQWWDPTGQPLATCDIDLRPGGSFRFVHRGPQGGYAFVGTYREIKRPSRLVFTTPAPSGGEIVGTLVLLENGATTAATVTMTCASKADRDALLKSGVDRGTVQTLENLDTYLGGIG